MTLKLKFAGFNYVADIDGSYASANSLASMISDTASNSVALTDDYGISPSTNTIYGDYNTATTTGNTETIAHLTNTIKAAEKAGLTVMVRPLVDFTVDATPASLKSSDGTQYANGDWRAYFKPTDTTTFFNSYDSMIVDQAKAAQAGGAQLLDIGTELDQLTGSAYLTEWTKIISDVRAVFSGKLTYSAISDDDLSPWQFGGGQPAKGTGDLTTQVSFWSQLDYIGIDEYAAISDANNGGANPDPTLTQLIAGWENTPTDPTTKAMTGGLSLIKYYENVSKTLGKPLLFTEIGYNSAPDAASQPFFTSSSKYDPTLQANLFKAFFTAWQADGDASLEGVYIWNWEPDPSTIGAGTDPSWTPQGNTGALQVVKTGFTAATACYAAGTRIATSTGERAIEELAVGDWVRIAGVERYAPIIWLGHRCVDCRRHPRPHDVWPIRVRRGAFGAGVPHRDLLLSPDHAVFMDGGVEDGASGVLIPIRYLVNGTTIAQEAVEQITYWHVELPRHDVIVAEGLATESYLDTGNRSGFANCGGVMDLHPDFASCVWEGNACAPLVLKGPELVAAKHSLRDRAIALGYRVTDQPGLKVLVNGSEVLAKRQQRMLRVRLSESTAIIRLVSRVWVPAHMEPDAGDARLLGIAISRVWVDSEEISLGDPCFTRGWHAHEQGWRWTDGDAWLVLSGAHELAFEMMMTGTYWEEASYDEARAA